MSEEEEAEADFGQEEDGEVVIGDSDCEFSFTPDDSEYFAKVRTLTEMVHNCSAYLPDCTVSCTPSGEITVILRRDFLPLSLQAVLGLQVHSDLLHLSFSLDNYNWNLPADNVDVSHPVLAREFVGRPLVTSLMGLFFSRFYEPKTTFRSAPYLLSPPGNPKRSDVNKLVAQHFDEHAVVRALCVCKGVLDHAATFLKTGALPPGLTVALPFDYAHNPLMHFILELGTVFLDLSDHCCLCRAPVNPGVKPSTCDSELCRVQMSGIGIGNSVVQEIRRDPLAADLVLSIFAAAVGSPYLKPAPPGFENRRITEILKLIPSMTEIVSGAQSDSDLRAIIGEEALSLLRWVLLSNRSHMIHLGGGIRLAEFPGVHQFMALLSSPESEEIFNALKAKYGSFYLWHGSRADRWHPIIRSGLRNLTGTPDMANGQCLGAGIYFARRASTSWGYSQPGKNPYLNSALGQDLQIISLCEVAKLPAKGAVTVELPPAAAGGKPRVLTGALTNHDWAYTLTMEEACIVRFLMIGPSFERDCTSHPLAKIPTLRDVLEFHAQAAR
jgi:poly [ADP-ribose] polymerase 6/8